MGRGAAALGPDIEEKHRKIKRSSNSLTHYSAPLFSSPLPLRFLVATTSELKANATDAKKDDSKSSGMMSMLGPMLGDLGSTLDGMKISLTATIKANEMDAMSCDAVVALKKK